MSTDFEQEETMKSFLAACAGACLLLSAGCVDQINVTKTMGAASSLASAATTTDAELKQMSKAMREKGDAENTVAPANNKYAKRLTRLMKRHQQEGSQALNYKVYLTSDVNANASADGSVRVYSGLMDLMNDDELLYVLGHEIGHVMNGDSLNAVRVAYTTSAVRQGAGALNSTLDALSSSQLGDLLEATVNAQFSQKQELGADAYSLEFMKKYGYNTKAAVTALRKLEKLSAGGGILSSHPAPGDRAARIEKALGL